MSPTCKRTFSFLLGFSRFRILIHLVFAEHSTGARGEFFEAFGGLDALVDGFRTDVRDGLPQSEAEERDAKGHPAPYHRRAEAYGVNIMPKRKGEEKGFSLYYLF